MLISVKNRRINNLLIFYFKASNNEVEYEAIITSC